MVADIVSYTHDIEVDAKLNQKRRTAVNDSRWVLGLTWLCPHIILRSMAKQFWLMKSEPGDFSIEDLRRDHTTCWSGVRNYQARNFMRDQMQVGDGALIYHSTTAPVGVAGMAEVIKASYPDPTAWDKRSRYYDIKSTPDHPIWFMVDIRFVKACREVITLKRLKSLSALRKMCVVQRGNRLSITPVTASEWDTILSLPEW